MLNMPVIKIEIDHMRQSIVRDLGSYAQELEQQVNAELKKVVENFDYAYVVKREADIALQESIKSSISSYFKYGKGKTDIELLVNKLFGELTDEK